VQDRLDQEPQSLRARENQDPSRALRARDEIEDADVWGFVVGDRSDPNAIGRVRMSARHDGFSGVSIFGSRTRIVGFVSVLFVQISPQVGQMTVTIDE
jgi:hypothetical protein